MVHMARNMRVPPNSASLAEAKKRTLEFVRMYCRSIPEIMEIYNLYDVVSPLNSVLLSPPKFAKIQTLLILMFYDDRIERGPDVSMKQVIDMLLFKGMEELKNCVDHSKQRHHLVGKYVVGNQGLVQDLGHKDQGI